MSTAPGSLIQVLAKLPSSFANPEMCHQDRIEEQRLRTCHALRRKINEPANRDEGDLLSVFLVARHYTHETNIVLKIVFMNLSAEIEFENFKPEP